MSIVAVSAIAACLRVEVALHEARWPEHVVPTMVAIAYAESKCRAEALHQTQREKSIGPLQINVRAHPWVSEACARSYRCSARAALRIYRRQGLRAWSVYRKGLVTFVNGGAQGALHISTPWGDTLLASMYGTGAAFYGSEPAVDVLATMNETPEPYMLPELSKQAQDDRGTCREKCVGLPTIAYIACATKCGYSVQELGRGNWGDLGKTVAVYAIGIGLVLLGALALTR